ncbi:MAG: methyltransferase [Candidatus Methanoperedens sp.]|nr:methyltransferase [Candidatus Methanoperedens sp.]MCZ7394546.1 methyltransferase [Candidatus Methanoperedens sp.]
MKCPTCGGDCILPAPKVLDEILGMYMACSSCPPDPKLSKGAPFHEKMDSSSGRCRKCGKRHLDFVIGNVLTILKENGIFPEEASLKEVGTPLIAFGFPIPYPPRLGNKSLVLIMDSVTEEAAGEIVEHVPEVKGVIKRKGLQSQSVGILDTDSTPHTYELLAGCDMRCDVVTSSFGELCIYKNQSKIHIEFNNTKIEKIEQLYLQGEFDNACIVDGFCGPGTLGLLGVLAGAKKVILNDAWLPALRNAILNIRANCDILGVKIEFEEQDYNKLIGDEPVLLAKAGGRAEVMVYHGDVRKLDSVVKECDVCLIDTFPSVNPEEFISLCRDIARRVVVI